jgi:hypothetical protein
LRIQDVQVWVRTENHSAPTVTQLLAQSAVIYTQVKKESLKFTMNKHIKVNHKNRRLSNKQQKDNLESQKDKLGQREPDYLKNLQTVLIDQNLLCDLLFDRTTPAKGDIDRLLNLIILKKIKGYITQIGLNEILFLSECLQPAEKVAILRNALLEILSICKIDEEIINKATLYRDANFTVAIDAVCYKTYELDAIVTYNQEFSLLNQEMVGGLTTYTPSDFLGSYSLLNSNCKPMMGTYMINQISKLEHSFQSSPNAIVDPKPSVCDWILEDSSSESIQNHDSKGRITLWNPVTKKRETVTCQAPGAFEALSKAFNTVIESLGIFPEKYELERIFDINLEQGIEACVKATSIIKYQGKHYLSSYTHRDSLKAKFYAYVFSVGKICLGEEEITFIDSELSRKVRFIINTLSYKANIQFHEEELELAVAFCHNPSITYNKLAREYPLSFESQALFHKTECVFDKIKIAISETKQGRDKPVTKITRQNLAKILQDYQIPLDNERLDILSHIKP